MPKRIAIIDGIRTPICRAAGIFENVYADDLGAFAVKELLARASLPAKHIDELIFGNVCQPVSAPNIARIIALKAGLPNSLPAYTVQRNCGSGAESITTAADKILAGKAEVIIAGGTESMSNIPLLFNKRMTKLVSNLATARTSVQKLKVLLSFRPRYLKPVVGLIEGLTDPITGLIMGKTAEILAREFRISRDEQDDFSIASHARAIRAMHAGVFEDEICPLPVPPDYHSVQHSDDGPRENEKLTKLRSLRPYFDRRNGTVTVGNSCSISDGAAAILVMTEEKARELGLKPLGFLVDYAYAGLEPERMGLGPVYATARLLKQTNLNFEHIKLIELNEAFAAQVLANLKAFASDGFAVKYLNLSKKVGDIDPDVMNVNGGAIALGHPVGMTGTRLVLTLLKELQRRQEQFGLATMCIGGGQGGALLLEIA